MAGKQGGGKLHSVPGRTNAAEEHRRQVLYGLLAAAMPREQAEKTAARLLEAFGNFDGVFNAPPGELERLAGIGPSTAEFLRLVYETARLCAEDKADSLRRIYDTASAVEAFRPKFLGRKTEAVALMLLNGRGQVIYNSIVNEGALDEVPVYNRRIAELCIRYNAPAAMIAHNHPSGNAWLSANDSSATRDLELMLQSIDVELQDHIIFADNDFLSFRDIGLLRRFKQEVREFRLAERAEAIAAEEERRAEKE